MSGSQYFIIAFAACALGYGLFLAILSFLPRKLRAENARQQAELLSEARRQAEIIRAEEHERLREKLQIAAETMEETLKNRREDLKLAEEELNSREHSIQSEEARVDRLEKDIETHQAKVDTLKQAFATQSQALTSANAELAAKLEEQSGLEATSVKSAIRDALIETRRLESQRLLKVQHDELNTSSRRVASRALSRTLSRYAPEFFWPKAINTVDLPDPRLAELLAPERSRLLLDLHELAGVEIELLAAHEGNAPIVKLAGGSGVCREAARLALVELFTKGQGAWAKAQAAYERHKASLDNQALRLGQQATRELRVEPLHSEIQKLIGSLYWRTSYRQNQYHHSVEVAKLAGILAAELGVDPQLAKRCGLLHDIGKAIDYRIEGSHAVISGDYADRYGESRLICDAVMSHHNDLIVETPLAYVLKSADTLSGARPGARVNLEEGYQIRLSAIDDVVRSFPGILKSAIMNGGREVHVEVNHKKVREADLPTLSAAIAKRIEEEVAFPGQIKVLVTRRFEAVAVA